MIILDAVTRTAINPALRMLPVKMDTPEARVMLLAVGLQESRFQYRYQKIVGKPYIKGPARGYWQFEEGGGVKGVLNHGVSKQHAERVCMLKGIILDQQFIWVNLETDDVLAAAFARLLLYTDPRALPALNADPDEAWDYYVRNWRPGKPHRGTWDPFLAQARAQV